VIALDTTILVYAKGGEHPLAEPCRRLIAAVADGRVQAGTTAEVVQEFVHVYSRRRDRREGAAIGRDYAELLAPLLPVSKEALVVGLSWFERSPRLGAFDAVLAASAVAAGATPLMSADAAFDDVRELSNVFPDMAGVNRVLDAMR
jgi:uncharacterized protein